LNSKEDILVRFCAFLLHCMGTILMISKL